ncbi:conserved hypothetical protein [Clostridioides difficile]|uniref:Uncharacterized protein n=1 Tax=Clostridioides difficile (strain 630) TaxID=272563 RepID=F3Y5Y5_CLOD6|nr:conserved hypothetical protein [Clostridioides difficile 630]CEJ97806.1 conserved hypothetical protein [Clostridioides difficile]
MLFIKKCKVKFFINNDKNFIIELLTYEISVNEQIFHKLIFIVYIKYLVKISKFYML